MCISSKIFPTTGLLYLSLKAHCMIEFFAVIDLPPHGCSCRHGILFEVKIVQQKSVTSNDHHL